MLVCHAFRQHRDLASPGRQLWAACLHRCERLGRRQGGDIRSRGRSRRLSYIRCIQSLQVAAQVRDARDVCRRSSGCYSRRESENARRHARMYVCTCLHVLTLVRAPAHDVYARKHQRTQARKPMQTNNAEGRKDAPCCTLALTGSVGRMRGRPVNTDAPASRKSKRCNFRILASELRAPGRSTLSPLSLSRVICITGSQLTAPRLSSA